MTALLTPRRPPEPLCIRTTRTRTRCNQGHLDLCTAGAGTPLGGPRGLLGLGALEPKKCPQLVESEETWDGCVAKQIWLSCFGQ